MEYISHLKFMQSPTIKGADKQLANENQRHIRLEQSTYDARAKTITTGHLMLIGLSQCSQSPLLAAKCNLVVELPYDICVHQLL